ncbi:PREDICTED: high affinity immunoglobulin gamma Fc receptor I-like [Nanorana parkeri]|uniref:high affinity immunoglobulin gamma Fc receptor I-like n=1 Tax=Nanorana parkeri TaxID=125878 RepID=UPI000853F1D8|nr:PREDICTED: high affinity immunoglobulin gamma Fc receptor I-like [Nanorana parkeri]
MTPSTALIVLLSTVLGHAVRILLSPSSGSAVSPVVTFTPNWKKIFIGESMTMTCDVGSTGGGDLTYTWIKDGKWVIHTGRTFTITSAAPEFSGDYSCRAELFVKPTIIGIQYPEVEGDHMTLTCDTSLSPLRPRTQLQFAFYRDGRKVQEFGSPNQYGVQSAQLEDSGSYSCDVRTSDGKVRNSSHFLPIVIKELFSTPVLNVSATEVLEDDSMTLTCDTSLSPLRTGTQLQFAFYRDGRNVQEFGSSHQYGVQSAQLGDSGSYSCEVRSSNGKVRKSSHFTPIVIKGKSRTDNTPIIMAALLVSLLVAAFLLFMYRHKLHRCPHQRRGRQPQIPPTHIPLIHRAAMFQFCVIAPQNRIPKLLRLIYMIWRILEAQATSLVVLGSVVVTSRSSGMETFYV